jgi:hypothetical protein
MSHKTGEIYVQFIRLLQSRKAALHKDMQKHQQQNPHLCMLYTITGAGYCKSSGLWIEYSEAPLYITRFITGPKEIGVLITM